MRHLDFPHALLFLLPFSSSFPTRHRNYFDSADFFSCPGIILILLPFLTSLCLHMWQCWCTQSACSQLPTLTLLAFPPVRPSLLQSSHPHFTDFVCIINTFSSFSHRIWSILLTSTFFSLAFLMQSFPSTICSQMMLQIPFLSQLTSPFHPIICSWFSLPPWALPSVLFMGCLP